VNHIPHLGDTPYQEDSILLTYGGDAERALRMLDSAVILGNIDEYNEQVLRATIYSRSLEIQRQDSAISICMALLDHDSVKSDPGNYESVLNLLINSNRAKADDNEYLRWSIAKVAHCREQGKEVELLRTEAEIGMIMTHLGQVDVGMKKLNTSIEELDRSGSVDRMDAFVIAAKRKITVLNELKRYNEIIPLASRVLERLAHYEQHADEYAEDSYRLSWTDHPSDREHYLDFYRAQAHGFMAQAYAEMGDEKNAHSQLAVFNKSGYGKTFSGRRMIVPTQMALRLYDDAMSTCDQSASSMGPDTLNPNYSEILRNRAIVAHAEGRTGEAYDWMSRYAHLNKIISDSLHNSEAHYYSARYQAKEQQLKIQESENRSKILAILTAVFALIMIATTIASIKFRKQRQRLDEKNHALVNMINESKQLNVIDDSSEASAEDIEISTTQISDEEFALVDSTIRKERLYSNVNLQRQDICNRFGISRIVLNNMLFQYRGNASLPRYINSIRMEEAVKLLRTRPDMSITAIAEYVGFSAANFRKHFTQNFGMTPIEYRQNL